MEVNAAYMHRCIALAKLGAGQVAPNPMVGAVLVHGNTIIGEGYHRQYGQAHAEVNCLQDAAARTPLSPTQFQEKLQQSTLYVSLEPCAHFGKTPPCADLIIDKKIPEVVIGCRDPFALVNGKGVEKLLAAGITVHAGVLEEACRALNSRFFIFHTQRRPYIVLKWAQSADGKIAGPNRSRVLISNPITNRLVHKWRSEEAAILVGTTTALTDDPSLTNRLWSGNHPLRMVVDLHLKLPPRLQLFNGHIKTVVFNTVKQAAEQHILYEQVQQDKPLAPQLAEALHRLNIQSVLVEGGSALLQSFIDAQRWDEARVITNQELFIPGGLEAPRLPAAALTGSFTLLSDTVRTYTPIEK